MNLIGALAVTLAVVGFSVAFRCLAARPVGLRIVWCLAAVLLAVPPTLFAVYYLHVLPEMTWFYTLRSWPGSELLAVFLGAAGGAIAALLPRCILVLPLAFSIAGASVPYLKTLIRPLDAPVLDERWNDGICLQSTGSTCGPASATNILHFHNLQASERDVAVAAHTSQSGTEAWYLARYLRSRGLPVRFDFRSTFTPAVGLPVIVGVRLGAIGHFIAVLEITDGEVVFVDPASGRRRMDLADFIGKYSFTGFHLVVGSD